MNILFPIILIFMFFIIWNLAKESKAGRFGTIMMFIVLGGGFFGYLIKQVMIWYMSVYM